MCVCVQHRKRGNLRDSVYNALPTVHADILLPMTMDTFQDYIVCQDPPDTVDTSRRRSLYDPPDNDDGATASHSHVLSADLLHILYDCDNAAYYACPETNLDKC
jgi:hypothetical protein